MEKRERERMSIKWRNTEKWNGFYHLDVVDCSIHRCFKNWIMQFLSWNFSNARKSVLNHCKCVYLFFFTQLKKDFVDFLSPASLHRVEWFIRRLSKARLCNFVELLQNLFEWRSFVRILCPTIFKIIIFKCLAIRYYRMYLFKFNWFWIKIEIIAHSKTYFSSIVPSFRGMFLVSVALIHS